MKRLVTYDHSWSRVRHIVKTLVLKGFDIGNFYWRDYVIILYSSFLQIVSRRTSAKQRLWHEYCPR